MYFLNKNTDFSSPQMFCLFSYSRMIVIDSPKSYLFVLKWKELNYCKEAARFLIEKSVLLMFTAVEKIKS